MVRVIQVTYNWFSCDRGEFFYDYTVGNPAYNDNFHKFEHQGKIVKSIAMRSTPDGYQAIVDFEDGTSTIQGNINSISYGDNSKENK